MISDKARQLAYWVMSWGDGKAAQLNGMRRVKIGDDMVEGIEVRVQGRFDQGTIVIVDDHRAMVNIVPKRKDDYAPFQQQVVTFEDLQDGMYQLEEVKLHMRV